MATAELVAFPAAPNGTATADPPAKTKARRRGMGYEWEIPAPHPLTLRVDYLRMRGGEYQGEFEVLLGGKHLHAAVHNLSSTTSRKALVSTLAGRGKSIGEADWDRYVEGFCAAVIRKEREGEPLVLVGRQPVQPVRYLVDELVQEGKPNLLFGPGGGGKGYLSVLLCVLVKVGRGLGDLTVKKAEPIYFDWEDDAATMNDRIQRVCAGLGIPPVEIAYKRMKGLAADRLNEMARAITDVGATYAVLDSVSAAAGTPGRGETWDSVAHRLFDSLDLIPCADPARLLTWSLIDHVTGDSAGKRGDVAGKAFGSIQKMNRARCAWELRSEQEDGASVVRGTLYHAKWNHTGKKRPIGLTFTFEGDAVRIEKGAPTPMSGRVTVADRIAEFLGEHGKQSVRALELALRLKGNHLRAELVRHSERFVQDSQGFWHLTGDDVAIDDAETPEIPF